MFRAGGAQSTRASRWEVEESPVGGDLGAKCADDADERAGLVALFVRTAAGRVHVREHRREEIELVVEDGQLGQLGMRPAAVVAG